VTGGRERRRRNLLDDLKERRGFKLLNDDDVQNKPFTPSPSHLAAESESFRFRVKICSRSALSAGPENYFHREPNSLLAAPYTGAETCRTSRCKTES
jgi:hypothetical protein